MNKSRKSSKRLLAPVTIRGRFVTSITPAAGFGGSNLSPALSNRLAAIGDVYEEYRFTSLAIRPVYATATQEALAFQPNVSFTANPASFVETAESGKSIVYSTSAPNVLPTLTLNRDELNQGITKWWRYPAAAPATELEIQGVFWFFGSGSTVATFIVSYEIEFRAPVHSNPSRALRRDEAIVVPRREIEDDRSSQSSYVRLPRR